ncbi:MAG: glycosyltransferase family 1 protein [Flavobacteriaceae bacterium]|nr:glycosyltransferase family 1 protein [Flavobacteriaceae bacterium]
MTKILIDLERLRYPNSGIANVFRNLGKELQENEEFDFSFFGPKEELQKINPSIRLIDWKFWHKFFENFSPKFDLIHASHQLSSYFHRDYKKAKKLLTLHDLNFLHENLSDAKKKKMLNKVNQNLKNADYLVCISHFVKEEVLKNQHLLNLEKVKEIFVVYNGVDLPENKKYDLGKYQFLENKRFILNIGVLFDKKNQKKLIQMLPYIQEDLVLVSSAQNKNYEAETKQIVNQLKLENRVHFLSNISEEEKYALIQHCQAMCHPSIAEGFGIPPIEAMAFGKPVFLSTFTSLPEIGGEVAFYFETLDPENMAKTFQDKMSFYTENQKIMSEKIKKWASKFSKNEMLNDYLNIYKKILSEI